MTSTQRTTLHLALRLLGRMLERPTAKTFHEMHGLMLLAINVGGTSPGLIDVSEATAHLYLETD